MKTAPLFLLIVASCISVTFCKDLIVGASFNNRLIWQEKAEYNSIPFNPYHPGQEIIKGIIARDVDQTDSIAPVTAGGVGSSYANNRLQSERGAALNYQLEYYI